jgi:hypothetical protein
LAKGILDGSFDSTAAAPLMISWLGTEEAPDWVGLLERRRGIVGRLFNGRQKNVEFDAPRLIDAVLSSSELISDVRWHYDESALM